MTSRSKPNREAEAPGELKQDRDELPEGWGLTPLGNVCEIIGGSQPSKDHFVFAPREDYIRLIQIRDYKSDNHLTFIPKEMARRFCTTSDVMIGRYGPPLFQILRGIEGAYNVALMKAVPLSADILENDFLFYLLQESKLRNDVIQFSERTVGQDGVRKNLLEAYPVRIPPLAEQRRIVVKLELLLGKVSSSQQRLSRVPGLLKRFRQSVLAAACSGKLTADWREENPSDAEEAINEIRGIDAERRQELVLARQQAKQKGDSAPKKPCWEGYDSIPILENDETPASWTTLPAGFLCDCIVPGRDKPKSFTGSVPWVTLPDINGHEISASVSGLGLSASEIEEVNARVIPVNAVVMSCIGRFGLAAVVTSPIVVNQQLHAFLPSRAVLPMYLALNIPVLAEFMNSISTSTTIAYINKDNCNSIPINTPPLAEQQEIVRRVEKLFAFADQIEARLKLAQSHVDRITQSLLAKAFRGELVPTEHALAAAEGRDYETASELLDRIMANQDIGDSTVKPKRKQKSS
jgi:type I restriction enzyme, S subunit